MRLVFDLFPCQTSSCLRGIGRYTHSLVTTMASLRGGHDMLALTNGLLADSADALRQDLHPLLPPGRVASYTYPVQREMGGDAGDAVASAVVLRAYEDVAPDAVLYANPFEGWGEQGVVALPRKDLPSAVRVAVLYDFIPWLFKEQYFNHIPGYREWYEKRLAALHDFDLLLAISASTRNDALDILGLPGEKVVNISGGVGGAFRRLSAEESARHRFADFGIARPFVLYTGNGDYRKNQDGILKAYAQLPVPLRRQHQLVMNQVGDMEMFRHKARSLGLADDEIVVTGHVTDEQLVYLYNRCIVFIFPSLYEGFGLPILEAMACGAPVIAANNSSMPEVTGRTDILFDARQPEAIADALTKVLTDDRLREELSAYGMAWAKTFSWEKTASLAWQAIERALESKQARPAENKTSGMVKPRIALVCPDLPDTTAGRHCLATLPLLARHYDIDLFVEDETSGAAIPGVDIYPHTSLESMHHRYATFIHHVDDDARYACVLPLTERFPGVIVLHDARTVSPVAALARHSTVPQLLDSEILYSHGMQGWLAHRGQLEAPFPVLANRHLIESASCLVVPDITVADRLESAYADAWLPPLKILDEHDEAAMLSAYRRAIERAIATDERHSIGQLADALAGTAVDEQVLNAIANHVVRNRSLRAQARLLIDVTQLAKTDARSGIQRVVRNIARELCRLNDTGRPIEIVRQANGKLWRASAVIASLFGIEPAMVPEQEIPVHPGDTLLMIDSSWEQYEGFSTIFQSVRLLGGQIVTVVYDLIPLRFPQTCDPGLVAVFRNWFAQAVAHSDMLLCISRATADDARAWLAEHAIMPPRRLAITHWPLGADIVVDRSEAPVRQQVLNLAADSRAPLFLMVGTVEPRKGHEVVLDAFDRLWKDGSDVRLCIAGGIGWMVEKTARRVLEHPQLNRKLFFVEKFTDAEINHCYAASTGLVAASLAEGFGLPIVEAALHRVPPLVSDIPVFREVGGEGALYFRPQDSRDLADKILQLAAMPASSRQAMAARVKLVSWSESARCLLKEILPPAAESTRNFPAAEAAGQECVPPATTQMSG